MNNDNMNEIIKNYLYDETEKNEEEKKIIISLFLLSKKIDTLLNYNNNYDLKKLEDAIYLVGNKNLDDKERINLEMLYFQNVNNYELKKKVNNINNYIKSHEYLSSEDIEYLKQEIVKLQILSGEDITFFEDAYKLLEKYISKIKNKKVIIK